MNNDTISVAIVDALLFNLLDFLKQLVSDDGTKIAFTFNGYDTSDFIYNSMPYDDMSLITNYDDDNVSLHVDLLLNFWKAQDFRFRIESTSLYKIELTGNFLAMFGLDPSKTYTLTETNYIDARLPVYGHNYICLSSNIGSNALSATCGERLQTTNLLSIIPTERSRESVQCSKTQSQLFA